MDMAGNVWEWMENFFSKEEKYPALHGGSWGYRDTGLRCSARFYHAPHYHWLGSGFRVLRGFASSL
jgi:formylglycine-generating enzyme required for sulfatase activity